MNIVTIFKIIQCRYGSSKQESKLCLNTTHLTLSISFKHKIKLYHFKTELFFLIDKGS